MAGGARKENRRERGTAHSMFAVTQTTRQGLTHRSGLLVVIIAHPGRREWRGCGEGMKRERWHAGQH
jgi:hypothetical protein